MLKQVLNEIFIDLKNFLLFLFSFIFLILLFFFLLFFFANILDPNNRDFFDVKPIYIASSALIILGLAILYLFLYAGVLYIKEKIEIVKGKQKL